jgi:hypothetical protein
MKPDPFGEVVSNFATHRDSFDILGQRSFSENGVKEQSSIVEMANDIPIACLD